jgi:hypothetical protein
MYQEGLRGMDYDIYVLEERKALYGPGEVPLSLSNEIDLVQEKIDTLSEELGKMQ